MDKKKIYCYNIVRDPTNSAEFTTKVWEKEDPSKWTLSCSWSMKKAKKMVKKLVSKLKEAEKPLEEGELEE